VYNKKIDIRNHFFKVIAMDSNSEVFLRRADIWRARAELSRAEARYYEARANRIMEKAVTRPSTPENIQILHPKTPPPLATRVSEPTEIKLEIKGAFCPKWTKRQLHYTIATTHKVVGEKHPIHEHAAFFVLLGDEIAFLGLIGPRQTHASLDGYTYQHSIQEGIHQKIKFEVFAKHYKLDTETQKQITKPRSGPKLDKRTTDILEEIAIKIIESGRLLA
jgi:hypothetical protein